MGQPYSRRGWAIQLTGPAEPLAPAYDLPWKFIHATPTVASKSNDAVAIRLGLLADMPIPLNTYYAVSIALMISSRSLSTATGMLAKRRSPWTLWSAS